MTKKWDLLANAALAMAIVGTASAEYNLAVAAGWGHVAFALPGCLDIYAVRAMRAHRDMAAVLVALIIVNSVSHLIAVGLLDPSVWVVIGVSSIAPAVLWRVHALRDEEPVAEPEPMDDHFRTAAELTETSSKLDEVPAEPADLLDDVQEVPVTLERVPEPEPQVRQMTQLPPAWPLLGPMTPVAELLAATPSATPVAPAVAPVALLSVADVAETKGVAEGTVRSWVKRDKLPVEQRDSNGRLLFHPDAVAALGATP